MLVVQRRNRPGSGSNDIQRSQWLDLVLRYGALTCDSYVSDGRLGVAVIRVARDSDEVYGHNLAGICGVEHLSGEPPGPCDLPPVVRNVNKGWGSVAVKHRIPLVVVD